MRAPMTAAHDTAPKHLQSSPLLTSLTALGTTLEVVHRHEKLSPGYSVEFRRMAPISGADFWRVCQGPNDAII